MNSPTIKNPRERTFVNVGRKGERYHVYIHADREVNEERYILMSSRSYGSPDQAEWVATKVLDKLQKGKLPTGWCYHKYGAWEPQHPCGSLHLLVFKEVS